MTRAARRPPFSIAALQPEYAGCWVAIVDGDVVDANQSPYDLVASLQERGITGSTIVRVPAENEPETVGIG